MNANDISGSTLATAALRTTDAGVAAFADWPRRGRWAQAVMAGSYPVTMAVAMTVLLTLKASGVHLTLASYGASATAAILVAWHEARLPYRREWRPPAGEFCTDATFMVAFHMAMPYLLGLTVTFWLVDWLEASDRAIDGLWPHGVPVVVQILMMLLIVDFVRYWIHWSLHRFPRLWSYHAVHHSPHRLYWVNSARIHPFEKLAHFTIDIVPFALLGVSKEALAAYYVLWGVTGFYQHSNCDVRFGSLNYVFSGPELHRWHHSDLVSESDHNYGNVLIIWDLVFGTWFLPRGRRVDRLGLINRDYPMGFLAQMRTPFITGLDKARVRGPRGQTA